MAELTNETIQKLNESIDKLSKQVGGKGGGGQNIFDKDTKKDVDGLGKASIKSAKDLVNFGSDVFASGARVSDAFKTGSSVIGNFTNSILDSKGAVSSIVEGAGQIGTAAIKAAETGVDTFRNLSSSGASFNNDILLMKNSAAQSRLTLDEFAGIVSTNSQNFAAFGGTVTKGAQVFTDASKDLFDTGLATPLLNMGMTFEEVNEDLAEYIARNRRRFTAEEIAMGKANASFAFMSTEMDKIAKITGQNRKELEKEVNDRARKGQVDAKIRMLEASGNKEAADKMKLALAEAAKAGPGALAAVEDLFTKGAVVSEEGRSAAVALGPAFNDLTNMVNVAKGPGGIDGMNTSIANFNGAISARINDPNFLQIATIGGMGNQFADAAAGLVETAGPYADNVRALMTKEGISREAAIAKLNEQAKTEQKSRDGVTATVINGEEALRDMGAIINDKLIGENGELTKFSDKLLGASNTLERLTRPEMTVAIDDFFTNMSQTTSLPGNAEPPDPNKQASDINTTDFAKAQSDAVIAALSKVEKKQDNEVRDLMGILSTDIGPNFINTLTVMAEEQGKTLDTLVAELATGGTDKQFRGIAKQVFEQQKPDKSADDFIKSLDPLKKVPVDDLLSMSSSVIKEMTVLKMNIPGKEFGGPVQKDQAYVVGEKRAELFVPQQSGYIVPSIKNLEANISGAMKQVRKPMQQGFDTSGLESTMREFAANMKTSIENSGVQNQMQDLAEQLNSSMAPVVGELMKGNRVAAKQLKGIGGLSGNLFKNIG